MTWRRPWTVVMAIAICVGLAAPASAQDAPQLTREQILQRIEALEAELAQLKAAVEQKTPVDRQTPEPTKAEGTDQGAQQEKAVSD